ncbi:MAG TPA: hypothetical protein VFP65_13205 [Anaeromyxobacteraceae bacterium]|nr:hypothetical protein [Anaeromyxobacteraceae bacterium]
MGTPRPTLTIIPGGRPPHAPDRPLQRGRLRLVEGQAAELEEALVEAVEAARQMRLEIERRIARALAAFEDRR